MSEPIHMNNCIMLGRPNLRASYADNVLAVDRGAPLRTRLLAAWTLLFGPKLLRVVSSWRSRNVRFTPTHWGR